jgi:hypothetical protein
MERRSSLGASVLVTPARLPSPKGKWKDAEREAMPPEPRTSCQKKSKNRVLAAIRHASNPEGGTVTMSERVAIYSRKSNEQHGSEETRSIAMQEGHARTCADAQGWTVVGHPYLYEDDDISGKEFVRRPGLQRVMRDIDCAQPPPFDILLTMEESRLGRDLFEAGANLKRIVESGVRVYFYGEQRFANISDATNCIMTAVRLGGAQME